VSPTDIRAGQGTRPRVDPGSALDELRREPSSRKNFLRLAGGGSAAVALSGLLAACGDDEEGGSAEGTGSTTPEKPKTESGGASAKGDIEIVNYALTLEYLEAEFYRQVIDSGVVKDKATVEIAQEVRRDGAGARRRARRRGRPAGWQAGGATDDEVRGGPERRSGEGAADGRRR